jgi:hypothetical protein
MAVRLLEGLPQHLARFAIDAPDRVAERLQRFDQVAVLLVQILFALRRRLELFDSR